MQKLSVFNNVALDVDAHGDISIPRIQSGLLLPNTNPTAQRDPNDWPRPATMPERTKPTTWPSSRSETMPRGASYHKPLSKLKKSNSKI